MELTTRVVVFILFHPLVFASILVGGESRGDFESVDVTRLPQVEYLQVGPCRVNENFHTTVSLRNRTNVGFTIREVDTDCGCTSAVVGTKAFGPNDVIHLDFEMAGANQIAKLRRSVRVIFHETSSPLVLHFDVRVRGPIEFDRTNFELTARQKTLAITGKKTDSHFVISDVVSGRGAFLFDGEITQDNESFCFDIVPIQRFGSISDIVRVSVRKDSEHPSSRSRGGPAAVEVPIELRWSSSVRFLPSTASLRREGDRWVGQTRMIAAARTEPLELQDLHFAFGRTDGLSPPDDCEGKIQPLSSVLSVVQITVRDDGQQTMPHFVEIEDRNGSLLGTLHLSLPGQNHAKN